jgi:hypothetical protein
MIMPFDAAGYTLRQATPSLPCDRVELMLTCIRVIQWVV